MKKDQVLDYIESLEKEDEKLASFVKTYEALSSFLTDFDFLKGSLGLTQNDVAEKMGTTQSAISRISSLKTNPSYKQLLKMAEAVGGELLITPMKDMTVQVPYDLQETVRKLANGEHKTTNDYLDEVIRDAVESEFEAYTKTPLSWNKVGKPLVKYKCESNVFAKKTSWSPMAWSPMDMKKIYPILSNFRKQEKAA